MSIYVVVEGVLANVDRGRLSTGIPKGINLLYYMVQGIGKESIFLVSTDRGVYKWANDNISPKHYNGIITSKQYWRLGNPSGILISSDKSAMFLFKSQGGRVIDPSEKLQIILTQVVKYAQEYPKSSPDPRYRGGRTIQKRFRCRQVRGVKIQHKG